MQPPASPLDIPLSFGAKKDEWWAQSLVKVSSFMSKGRGDPALTWGLGYHWGGKSRSPLPTPPLHHTKPRLTPSVHGVAQTTAPQKETTGQGAGRRGENIKENMGDAKNNPCVMRKQNWAASGAKTGYIQEEGGRNPPGSAVRHSGWKNLKSRNWNRLCQGQLFPSTEYDFKDRLSLLHFRHYNFKENICLVF